MEVAINIINIFLFYYYNYYYIERPDCGDGYTYWDGKCYKYYEEDLQFDAAVKVCEDEGGVIIVTGDDMPKDNMFIG